MKYLKILLLPISFLYGLITSVRNLLFDVGILPSSRFDIPVISVGNLSTGGTGKTPHVEYLINFLKKYNYNMGTLSRGYGRSTSGFCIADENYTSKHIGDEPLQMKLKFEDIVVAVDKKRVRGIKKLISRFPDVEVILLDDAYQHRYVKPGISILLTDYNKLYANDFMLPTGNLREWPSGAARADIVIVTKSPIILSPLDKRLLLNKLSLKPYQKIYFSYMKYGNFMPFLKTGEASLFSKKYYFENNYSVVLLTGIANSSNLERYTRERAREVIPVSFPDHHQFSVDDITRLKKIYDNIENPKKLVLTTEKDTMRLALPELKEILTGIPVFYMPLEVVFHQGDEEGFTQQILNHVK